MVLQGRKLSSWASLFVLKVEVNFDSIKEAVYTVRKWKKILFFHINWEISGKNEKMKQLNMTFLYLSFFTFSLCVILGPPTIKCQDRITCPWEKVWRQGWHSCQASVWGWLQLKESGRKEGRKEGRQAGWKKVSSAPVWSKEGLAGPPGSSDRLSGGSLCLWGRACSESPHIDHCLGVGPLRVRNDGFWMPHLGALG